MNLQVDGIPSMERVGQGRPVLLLHGGGRAVSLQKHQMPLAQQLKNRYEITMADFPGHGESESQAETTA